MSDFLFPEMGRLTDQQVRYAPPARRLKQVEAAEELRREIDPGRAYPYAFVCFRVTGYRPDDAAPVMIPGDALRQDLSRFMRLVERSLPAVPGGQTAEPMLSLEEIGKKFGVSTKTVRRWRSRGLVGRKVTQNGRSRLGFPASAVEKFATDHPEELARGARFSHLGEEEKWDILRRAARLAAAGASLTEATRRIARRLNRSAETVRYTIKRHDAKRPERAIFPRLTGPLSRADKRAIYELHNQGTAVENIAKQYKRAPGTIHRTINRARADELLKAPVDYIYHESFDDPAMAETILAAMPGQDAFESDRKNRKIPKDVPPEFTPLYEVPLLSKEQEQHLFRQMNFLKHGMKGLQDRIDRADPARSDLDEFDALRRRAEEVKETLIQCNMRLVVSIAKKHSGAADGLFELVSDGNVSLIRAVEKFDFSRNNKFSTYASWAIMKNFARSIPDEKTQRDRYMTGHEELFEARPDNRTDEQECLAKAEQAKYRVNQLLSSLDPRTQEVIRMRAGLDGDERTLEQIGQHFGITKERVRQINVRGMKILREKAAAEKIDLP